MENLNDYFIYTIIVVAVILIVLYLLVKYDKIIRIRDFKQLVAENNICNEAMIFLLLDRMSFEEMDLLSDEINLFLKNNFAKNLSVYKEGLKLIDVRINRPEKKKKIVAILDQLIYQKTRIPFLTANGFTTAKQFMAEEVKVELTFIETPGLKKELFIN